jgi:hypothetical protein
LRHGMLPAHSVAILVIKLTIRILQYLCSTYHFYLTMALEYKSSMLAIWMCQRKTLQCFLIEKVKVLNRFLKIYSKNNLAMKL